jgi:uncharacterized protein YjbI with pentapeptide repeats
MLAYVQGDSIVAAFAVGRVGRALAREEAAPHQPIMPRLTARIYWWHKPARDDEERTPMSLPMSQEPPIHRAERINATVALEPPGPPDDAVPSAERQAELRALRAANLAAAKAPYAGVRVVTRGELRWVLAEHGWSGEYDEYQVKYGQTPPGASAARADLREIDLAGANLAGAHLRRADLSRAWLIGTNFTGADLVDIDLTAAELGFAHLDGAILNSAVFQSAHLRQATLRRADLSFANLRDARLVDADLRGARLRGARLDAGTVLAKVLLDGETELRDVVWEGVQLAQVEWNQVLRLGDERLTRPRWDDTRKRKTPAERGAGYETAVRANRQLATALRAHGLNEHADRFAYRAQVLQRRLLLRQRKFGRWLFSGFLDILAGYGYRPGRSLIAYLLAILGFGALYYTLGQAVGPQLSPLGAIIFSMTSFHGRGFFPGAIAVDDPITALAALEAFVGLVIEISFIATFTQRFFGK